MRSINKFIILLIVLFSFAITSCAFAEIIPLDAKYVYILQEGDQLHVLVDMTEEEKVIREFETPYGPGKEVIAVFHAGSACYELTMDHQLIPCTLGCADVLFHIDTPDYAEGELLRFAYSVGVDQDHNTLLLKKETGELYRWTPSRGTPLEYVATVKTNEFELTGGITFAMLGDTVYFNISSYEENKMNLYAYNITTGETTLCLTLRESGGMNYAGNNDLFISGYPTETVYHCDTGKTEQFRVNVFNGGHSGIYADENGGWIYVGFGGLCHLSPEKKSTSIYTADGGGGFTSLHIRPGTGDCVFLRGNGIEDYVLYIYSLKKTEYEVLKVTGSGDLTRWNNNCMPEMTGFMLNHENVRIEDQNMDTFDHIAQQLVLRDDSFDMMHLIISSDDLRGLAEKGYYHDLSGNETIRRYIDSLYPAYREQCVAGERIVGVPTNVICETISVNRALWEELELGDLPTTYGELLDMMELWFKDGMNESYRLLCKGTSRFSSFDFLFDGIMTQYIAARTGAEETLSFQNEALESALTRLSAMKKQLDWEDSAYNTEDALLMLDDSITGVEGSWKYDRTMYQPLLMKVSAEEEARLGAFMKVLVVNPYSKNTSLAEEYIAYIAGNPTGAALCLLTTEEPNGVLKKSVEDAEEAENYEKRMAELKEMYEEARKTGNVSGMEHAEDLMENLRQEHEFRDYDVTPEVAAKYYAAVPYITVMESETYGFVMSSGENLLSAYRQGQMDAKTLTRRLDQLLQMRRMENQ